MKKHRYVVGVVGVMCVLIGCEEKSSPSASTGDGTQVADAAGAAADKVAGLADAVKENAGAAADAMREAAVSSASSLLEGAQSTLTELKSKAAAMPELARQPLEAAITNCQTQYDAAAAKFAELKGAGSDAWEPIQAELSGMLEKLTGALGDAGTLIK